MSQNTTTISQSGQQVYVDLLNQVYLINQSGIKKFNHEGLLLTQYQNAMYGTIGSLDVSNPLRLLVFYKNSGTLLFLNQQLTPIGDPLDCFEHFGAEIAYVCAASDGGFWLFNPEIQKIMHSNPQGEIIAETQSLTNWLTDANLVSLKEINNQLYLVSEHKILVFDAFGTYLTSLHFESIKQAFFSSKNIIIHTGTQLISYHLTAKSQEEIPLSIPENVLSLGYQPGLCALLYKNQVELIRFNL